MAKTPGDDDADEAEGVRLQKLLAAAGVDSRRKCEEYVVAGRVTVDGHVVTDLAAKVDPERHDVRLDGERIRPQKKRYFLLNKPPGYLCTNYDRTGRPRAVDLVPTRDARLFTVGRLDEDSQGLLLVTNDGELAERLAHPRFQVPRVYRVQVAGVPSPETLAQLREGLYFTEGRFHFRRTKRLKTQGKSAFVEVELTQGQNREIRRLFARVGHKVIWLQRVAFGPLKLGDLPPGRFRPLRPDEVKELRAFVRANAAEKRKAGPRRRAAAKPTRGDAAPAAPVRRILDTSAEPARKPAADRPAARKPRTAASKFGKPGTGRASGGRPATGKPLSGKPMGKKPARPAGKPRPRKPSGG